MAKITVNEVRRRLQMFAKEHANDTDEKQHAQQFWRDFYQCFGLSKSSASMFEARVIKLAGERGYIDSFIPGLLLVEQKTLGKDLKAAYEQAQSYFHAIKDESEKPRYIVTCDFKQFNLYDLHDTSKEPHVCTLDELHKRADWFMFLADKELEAITEESPINRKAAYQVSLLHEGLLRAKFVGRDLEIFLTRLLFCFFADDTAIFGENGQFRRLLEATRDDGKDVGATIAELFQVLNQPHAERQTTLDEKLQAFEYINGSLFEEQTRIPSFNFELRKLLIECNELDWSNISPAIFGAMFQGVLEAHAEETETRKETRRELGAHYTSERNILRVINPLFLDELRSEFEAVKKNKTKLQAFYHKLSTLKFFDPACGCGNFLVIAFRELRRLENEVIASMYGDAQKGLLDVSTLCKVNVGQFYGIEIDEAAAHIARVAMWITDHQLNLEAAQTFGTTRATVPLVSSPHIARGNALRMDWQELLPANQCNYVMGNPPFIGHQWRNNEQVEDMNLVWGTDGRYGRLDYVSCWYKKSTDYSEKNNLIRFAFVSTNSIVQGEQVGILWAYMLSKNMHIHFAHQSFQWSNEGVGVATVQCVIVGFGVRDKDEKKLFVYMTGVKGEPTCISAKNINPYLLDAPNVVLPSRVSSPDSRPIITKGSQPTDGGHLILSSQDKVQFLSSYPHLSTCVKEFIGGEELLNGTKRYCLWLKEAEPELLRTNPFIRERLALVAAARNESKTKSVQDFATKPYLFTQDRQPVSDYMAMPRVSSERRKYIPIAYLSKDVIAHEKLIILIGASLSHFSLLNSALHNAWLRVVSGRLESRYSYSPFVYYNFPFPFNFDGTSNSSLHLYAQAILDARALYPSASLADLYDPLTMPAELVDAHNANNKAVDKAYGYKGGDDDASRVAFLFKLYEETTSLLPTQPAKKPRVTKAKKVDA